MALLFVSFLAGILTVLSPCVLPLLPIVVGGSLAGGKSVRRALVVTASLGVSVFAFTFLLKVSTALVAIPQGVWNWLSGGILAFVGAAFLFPYLWDLIPGTARANRDSNRLMSSGFMRQNLWGDVVVGAALGPVFSTCSPTYFLVLATVLPASLSMGVADIFAYILGLCLFLFVIAIAGQTLLEKLNVAADPNGWFRKILGGLFIVIAALIVTGTLAKVEAPLYEFFDATKLEQKLIPGMDSGTAQAATDGSSADATSTPASSGEPKAPSALALAQKSARYAKAPELVPPDAYLNTGGQPLSLASLRGKVVLVDFWTYSCINCQRTLPYLTTWYGKYKDEGLVIVGVHTPEFAFEHLESNVAAALKQFGIEYPVVLDNEYQTWNAYHNAYWPHEYLIDIDGYVVHDHVGEGGYAETEKAIQAALKERMERLDMKGSVASDTVSIEPADLSDVGSPETYFGANRNEYLANGRPGVSGTNDFALPDEPKPNRLYLGGTWDVESEYAEASAGASIEFKYKSKDFYFVASGDASGTQIEVIQDDAPIGSAAGKDVKDGVLTITGSRLYHVVANPSAGVHTIRFTIKKGSLKAYTFTFG